MFKRKRKEKNMAYYTVYWPQDRIEELKKAGDTGPIKVVYGSIHSRMPAISSINEGDVVFPITLIKKKLYVMARLPVTHRERAFDYCIRELGSDYSSLIPEGIAVEVSETFYWSWDCKSYDCAKDVPEGIQIVHKADKPHQLHQEPFNCCAKWAVWGEKGSSIIPRLLPDEVIPLLRFGYPKSKEKALRLDKKGNLLSMSLACTRRMSEETTKIFDGLF